ncbi:MAG TPA: 23S rRNA (guanosine(2251)-2'-O)-methyltransferase RlmB [Candidatus Tumulicola sp.]
MDRRNVNRRRGPVKPLDFDDAVYGIHAVSEALAAGERLRAVHVAQDRRNDPALRELLANAQERDVRVTFEPRDFFTRYPYRAHQGVTAMAEPFDYVTLDEAIGLRSGDGPALFVVLDHLTDPHNVGAILRTAECAGAGAMLLPDRRSAGINATVRKAAAGAAARVPVARVGNLATAIRTLKKAGIWVVGADAEAPTAMEEGDFNRDLALVIGAEGDGISQLVRRECDYLVRIPMAGRLGSLNASVAAGILMFEALRQRSPRMRVN